MLGHTLFSELSSSKRFDVYATVRNSGTLSKWFSPSLLNKVIGGVNVDNLDTVIRAISSVKPDVVINCIGLIKQLPEASDHLAAISVNSLLPHRIALLCQTAGARMIHFSTDCVFDGKKGNYRESDLADGNDLYGRTKLMGEVSGAYCLTLRTSIIGHELRGCHSLVEWFLAQKGTISGFKNVIYSGLPTVEIARLIGDYVIPNADLNGLYHLSSQPISKYELLKLVAVRYKKEDVAIKPHDKPRLDRSLDSSAFDQLVNYYPPSWPELVDKMYTHYISSRCYRRNL